MEEKNSQSWDEDKWRQWLEQELDNRQKSYEYTPKELIASYNREVSHTKDYHGRELLELIQNADDACLEYSKKSIVKIALTDDVLYVINSGNTFSSEGIDSLMISDISPKLSKGLKCIGYKGLGFRSILGWTSDIYILSDKARIGFSNKKSNQWLTQTRKKSEKINSIVNKYYEETGIENPIAILNVPYYLSKGNVENISVLNTSERYIEEGYETCICLVLNKNEDIENEVLEQIEEIKGETLLFLNHVEQFEIETKSETKKWAVDRDENTILIESPDKEPEIWDVFCSEGIIPDKYLNKEQKQKSNKFEIKLAAPVQDVDSNDRLYVYFPTQEHFPFPIKVHATFELSANRQYINYCKTNKYIADQLISLMVKVSKLLVKESDPWHAIKSLIPYSEISENLEKYNFTENLKEKLKNEKLVPTVSNEFIRAIDAKTISHNFCKDLKGKVFRDICLYDNDYLYLYEYLEIPELEYEEVIKRLEDVSDTFDMQERTRLILEVQEAYKYSYNEVSPPLLIDSSSRVISSQTTPYLPPDEEEFLLPDWAPLRIINLELVNRLKDISKLDSIRDLRQKLSVYKIQEYNVTSIVSGIVAETNRRIKKEKEKEKLYREEMLLALWNLFDSIKDIGNIQERITIHLPTRDNKYVPANEIYFGEQYQEGKLLELLYGKVKDINFIASPEVLRIGEDIDKIGIFLKWLGVNDWPRFIRENINDVEYKKFVVSKLNSPIQFGEFSVIKGSNLQYTIQSTIKNAISVEHLEQIIEYADPYAILLWICRETRIEDYRIYNDSKAKLSYRKTSRHELRYLIHQNIYPYFLWLLRTKKWVPITGGKKAPEACSISRKVKDLSPIIGYPNIDIKNSIFSDQNIKKTDIRNALTKVGVVDDLDEVPWSVFYDLMLKLPEIDKNGKQAKSVYRALIARTDIEEDPPSGEEYEAFMEEGEMYGGIGEDKNYYPIKELFYVENNTLPDHIVKFFPLVDIDRRRGAKKVLTLFGIEQLTIDKIEIEIIETIEHKLNESFSYEFKRILPYIYALRVEEDSTQKELAQLKKLIIVLCNTVNCFIKVEENKENISILPGKSIPDSNEKNIIYLVANKNINLTVKHKSIQDELIANAVGEIITNLFKVDISADIARIVSCSSENRKALLDQITGGSGQERLEQSIKSLSLDNSELEDDLFYAPEPEPKEKEYPEEEVKTSKDDSDEFETGDNIEPKPNEVENVTAQEVLHEPSIPRKISKRISVSNKAPKSRRPPKVTNYIRGENLAIKFEEFQGRYPLKVSYLQGSDTYGCDILSFDSHEILSSFRESYSLDLVSRFIEVKSSTNNNGSIDLEGNELKRAQKSQQKYYLYRIFEDGDGSFELVELNDPIDDSSIKIKYTVNAFQSERTSRYLVKELLEE